MQYPFVMHLLQPINELKHQFASFFLCQELIFVSLAKCFPFNVGQYHIGRVISFKIAQYPKQIWMIKPCQHTSLVQEAFFSPRKKFCLVHRYGNNAAGRVATGKFTRVIFLDSDFAAELLILRKVGDAKTTTSEDFLDSVVVRSVT